MAPIFGDSSRPKRKNTTTTNTAANGEKPVFAFKAPSTSGSNGFFRTEASPLAHHRPQQTEDGWDMGDDRSDESQGEMDDSQAEYDSEEEEVETMKPDFVAFASRLDKSGLLQQSLASNLDDSSEVVFNLITDFQNYSAETMEAAERGMEDMADTTLDNPRAEYDFDRFKQLARYWQLEHQTWELFGVLMRRRLAPGEHPVAHLPNDLARNKFTSDARIREHYFNADPVFAELTAVLEWLRRYSPKPTADEIEVPGLYREGGGWIYTKEEIKKQKRMSQSKQLSLFGGRGSAFAPASSQSYVTELDPDAPSRQGRQLEEQDKEWEQYLMKLVWRFLRRGEIENACDLCEDAGEFWRAASLNGGQDAWDPMIDGTREHDDEDLAVKGNRRRELWKRMCYALAHRRGGDEYEKASYGILCGDVESVLSVCTTWEDALFAHINSLVEGYYAAKLAELSRIPKTVTQFPSFDAMAAYHTQSSLNDDMIMPRILDEIAASGNVSEARLPLRLIQGSLISLRFPELVQELARQLQHFEEIPNYDPQQDELSSGLDATDPQMLRVVVHILIILQVVGASSEEGTKYHKAAESVISGYVTTLGECDRFELVPLYASRLSPENATAVVGKVLVHFTGDDVKREELIQRMYQYGVDAEGCLKKTMDITLEQTESCYATSILERGMVFNGFGGEPQPEDRQLIGGLEWLMLGGAPLRRELIHSVCEVYKRFLLTGRLDAASMLRTTIPMEKAIPLRDAHEYLDDSMEENQEHDHLSSPATHLAKTLYIAMESLIDALTVLESWREALKNLPERPDRTAARTLKPHYNAVIKTLVPVVKDFCEDDELLELTGIRQIRQIYVPELVIALHNVYMDAGNYINSSYMMKALELTNEVADPLKSTLDTFRESGRLAEYVDVVVATSRAILAATQDGAKDLAIWTVDK